MIIQTHPVLWPVVQTHGCYLMVLIWYANQKVGLVVSPELINSLYDEFVRLSWMQVDCKIMRPQEILNRLGVRCRYTDKHEPVSRICGPREFEVLYWLWPEEKREHFTAGDGYGHVTYDPMGESRTVRYGRLASKRIFERIA